MKKRIAAICLVFVVLFICSPTCLAEDPAGLSNFIITREYRDGQFTDVSSSDWFSGYAATAFRLGLMSGTREDYFNARGNVTIAETITVASRLHSIYYTGSCDIPGGTPWYQPYVDYALNAEIIKAPYLDYNRDATRAEYAAIMAAAFPAAAFSEICDIDDGAIPDVPLERSYAPAVYMLYRAGVLAGSDSVGTFHPDDPIKRSEVAAILTRIVDVSQRKEISLKVKRTLDAVDIAKKCSDAVFYIEIYDKAGNALASGSGFFIDPSGIAATNYHVIEGAASAAILLSDGTTRRVLGVYDYNKEKDIALLKVEGGGYSTLEIDASGSVVAGQHIYAIGSPYGLDNSISEGIISNPCRTMDGINYLQFTAPISSGSSGGAIIDDHGHVIGISTMAFVSTETSTTQNLNLAVPTSLLSTLQCGEYSDFPAQTAAAQTGALYIENQDSLYVGIDAEAYIPVFFESDGFVVVEYQYANEENGVASVSWGEFEDGWIPLYVTGNRVGTEDLTINLYAEDETTILASERILIHVVNAIVTASNYDPVVYANWFTISEIYQNNPRPDVTVYYDIDDPTIVSCEWGDEWIDENRINLMINGLRPGSTTVYVWIEDSLGNFLQYCAMDVTVRDPAAIYILPSSDSVTLAWNQSASINLFESLGSDMDQLFFLTENDNIVCEWGPWTDDYNTSLKITGIARGTSKVYVYLFAEPDAVAYAVVIDVTVR